MGSEKDCQEVIAEYDSSADGLMTYDEFLNLVMPAANQNLRDYCLYGRRVPSYFNDPSRPLPISVSSLSTRIIEREILFAQKRADGKKELFKNPDHQRLKTFNDITRGQLYISMSDLISYCEKNGFFTRTEDLEAILRRCDHDADRCLSYEEFCEVTELPGGEEGAEDADPKDNSPVKKELEEDLEDA